MSNKKAHLAQKLVLKAEWSYLQAVFIPEFYSILHEVNFQCIIRV